MTKQRLGIGIVRLIYPRTWSWTGAVAPQAVPWTGVRGRAATTGLHLTWSPDQISTEL